MDKITITKDSKQNIEYYSNPSNRSAFISLLVSGYKMNGNDVNLPVGENGLKTIIQGCCTSLKLNEPGNDFYQSLISQGYQNLKPDELISKFLDACKNKL